MSKHAFEREQMDQHLKNVSGQLLHVLDAAAVGVWRLDLATKLATWDKVASRIIYGIAEAQVEPAPLPIHPEDQELVLDRLRTLESGSGGEPLTVRVLRSDGIVRWIRASARPPAGAESTHPWLVGIVTDVTAEKEAQAAILESQRQLTTLVNHLPGIAYRCELKKPWQMTYVSAGVEALTGYPASDFTTAKLAWGALVHPEDVAEVNARVEASVQSRASFDVTYRVCAADGSQRWVQERGRAFYENEEPRFLEGFIWDISDAKQAQAKARWIANHDALTSLPNRLLLQETVEEKIDAGETDFAIVLLDVDDFKRTNDSLGHGAGDTLLREFAKRLTTTIGDRGLVARLGGDEFAIILQGAASEADINCVGHEILDALSAPLDHELGLFACSASMGASIFGQHGKCWTQLLKHADIALYAAKTAGRGNLKLFSNTMLNEVQVRNSMLALAGSAIASSGIVPHYQPKIALGSGEIIGFEALLRWQHVPGSLRFPQEISAAFDDPILATQLSDQMIEKVIHDVRSWLDMGTSFGHVAINASPAQFRRGDFAERLLEALHTCGIEPSFFQVEVTETVFLGRGSRYVEDALSTLDSAGVCVALDDFGTGYASLLHLAQYPVQLLKIDRSFVAKMISSNHDDAIVQAVISLGHSLGMKIVAEGVENLQQAARLRAKGCDYAQGFLYAPAMSSQEVTEVCSRQQPRRFGGIELL